MLDRSNGLPLVQAGVRTILGKENVRDWNEQVHRPDFRRIAICGVSQKPTNDVSIHETPELNGGN